jgi:hypothetical protein
VINDESLAGSCGNGYCSVYIDVVSSLVVMGDSELTSLYNESGIINAGGNRVSIIGTDCMVFVQGAGAYTTTVSSFSNPCYLNGTGA